MAVEESPAKVKQKKRGGCLKGCLITLLVILILVAGCSGGTYLLGRGYINRQIPVWEERYPWFGAAMMLFRNRGGYATLVERGVDDKSLLPADIPLYPEPLSETYSIGESVSVGYQRVAGPPAQLLEYVRGAMLENGWELENELESAGEFHLLKWRKGERTCETEVVGRETGSELWLRYTDEAQEQ